MCVCVGGGGGGGGGVAACCELVVAMERLAHHRQVAHLPSATVTQCNVWEPFVFGGGAHTSQLVPLQICLQVS